MGFLVKRVSSERLFLIFFFKSFFILHNKKFTAMSLTCVGSTSCAKSKSTVMNLNERDATRLLYHVQVFVIKTTISFYNYNM